MLKQTSKYFVFIALIISLFSFLILFTFEYVFRLNSAEFSYFVFWIFFISLFLGAMITAGLFLFTPIFSEAMITLRHMLRFESLSNPLLQKFSVAAPGTYHHSINVSVLAQKAAKSIGADSLVVRIAAYYHDIGKIEAPLNYVENQAGIEVPTDLNADKIRSNAKQIISHVANGIKIAQEHNLPQNIIDLIAEHHGTTRALYFYTMAKERGLKIKKTDFRYEGPAPRSKESLVLMLSDCVEATARSMPNLSNEKIKLIIDETITERIADKQFRNVSITDPEIEKIKRSLYDTLLSIYHQRMEYKSAKN